MQGHEPIIAMRLRGRRPAIVYLDTMRDHSPMPAWYDWQNVSPAIPTVWVQDSDVPYRLDLRFLKDLTVAVSGTDEQRVLQMHQAALDAGAFRVVSAVLEATGNREPKPMFRTVRVTDSILPSNDT